MDIKTQYASNHAQDNKHSLYLNERLFNTYNRVVIRFLKKPLQGINVDLGSGDKGFSNYCNSINITSFPYDYPDFDIEIDPLPHANESVDFVTLNAVIEHIQKPENIFNEIKRILKIDGLVFIRTPNWKMDYKNFYNDPTHVKPYSPETLNNSLLLFGLECVFIEPGLIEKSWFWWKLPNKVKWKMASLIKGGTKSILCVATKNKGIE